jgi:hypothetical protein
MTKLNGYKMRSSSLVLSLSIAMGNLLISSAIARAEGQTEGKIDRVQQVDRLAQASDVAGNWAEPFIKVLVEKGIIAGYPDGTFQPDKAVTRAEFAALLNKAFDLTETRAARKFSDVPARFWGASAIDKAYRAGFLSGYPNRTFAPNRDIVRIESLVAIATGTKIQAEGTTVNVDELFTDAGQVPAFGRDALIAATQKCLAVSVSYPEGKTFNPSGAATRADVAAFIHQALVSTGKLSALTEDNPAQKYIVNCGTKTTVATNNITEQDVLGKMGIGGVPNVEAGATTIIRKAPNPPVTGITTPSAFGANWGTFFMGAGYQDNLAPDTTLGGGSNTSATGLALGFGIGDSRELVGLETTYRTFSNNGGPGGSTSLGLFDRGAVNFKLHKQFGDNLAVAAGWENAILNGYPAGDNTLTDTFYGVLTSVLPVGDSSNFTASVGIGNGRFRSIADILLAPNRTGTSIFGSLGFRVSENIGLVADYNGRNFSVGLPLSLKMSDNIGIQVTPSILDVAGDKVQQEQTRFGIGGGVGIRF